MKKYILAFCTLICLYACNTEKTEEIKLLKTTKSFSDFFEFQDSVVLKPKDFTTPISITITSNKKFLLCDYEKKKVQLLNSTGEFIKDVLHDTLQGKKIGSPISVAINGNSGKIFIADNSNRRIHILDSNFNYDNSFIISGTHMTPVFMQSIGSDLYMCGHNINNEKFIHIYTNEGKFKSSFLTSAFEIKTNKYVGGGVNYVKFDTLNNLFYSIELLDYTISLYDKDYKLIKRTKLSGDFFPRLTQKIVDKAKKSFEEVRNSFAKPNDIKTVNNHVLVFSEMPTIGSEHSDYFNNIKLNLDIFDSQLLNNYAGIEIGNYFPISFVKSENSFYFLTHHDLQNNTYTIKKFKVKF